jgi:hypothetical protein
MLYQLQGYIASNDREAKVKGKAVPVVLSEHQATKAYWGVEVYLHAFFTSANRWR